MNLRTALGFFRIGFVTLLAYRIRYYTGVVTYLLNVAVFVFIWRAVYAGREGSLEGYDIAEMTTYIAVAWILRSFYHNNIDWEMADEVREGTLAVNLIKPFSYPAMRMVSAGGESLFRLLLFTPASGLAIGLVFDLLPPASPWLLLPFAVSVLLSFLIFAGVNLLVGIAAIHIKSIIGMIRAKGFIVQFLSGVMIPFTFFPPWLKGIAEALPFAGMAYTPLVIYQGKGGGAEIGLRLLHQLVWGVALLWFARLAWRRSLQRITIQGG